MKDKIPIQSKTIQNSMVKGIIPKRVGNCELVEGKHLMYDIPVIVNSLETSKNKHKLLTSDIIHAHDTDRTIETSIRNKVSFTKKLTVSAVNTSIAKGNHTKLVTDT
jgi:hypothetical protein